MLKKIIIIFGLIIFTKSNCQVLPESGFYDNLLMKVDSSSIDGYFYSNTGNGQITCFYKFKGDLTKIKDNSIKIIASYNDIDETYEGIFTFIDKSSFKIKFEKPLPGDMACDNVTSSFGNIFKLSKKLDFVSIGVLKNEKNYFYNKTNKYVKSKIYVLNDEAVAIISSKKDWFYVCYLGTKLIYGWMPKEYFYSF